MDILHLALLLIVGVVIGFINTIAGGGSLITIPMLMIFGTSIQVANGTNRIAILLQNASSFIAFWRKGVKPPIKATLTLAIATTAGSIVGALFAAHANSDTLRWVVIGLLAVMLVLIFLKPEKWLQPKSGAPIKVRWFDLLLFLAIGFYGGFIQAGAGLIVTTALVLRIGFDAVTAEALKSFILVAYTIFATVVFIIHDQVNFALGLALAVGSIIGAAIAANFAVSKGPKAIRYIIMAVMVFSAVYLLFFDK